MRGLNSKQKRRRKLRLYAEQSGLCAGCGEVMTFDAEGDEAITLDHVKPRSKGGTAAAYNTQLMHRRCNTQKADTPPWEGTEQCG